MCNFDDGWAGKCKSDGDPYCVKHVELKCCSCAAKATRSCIETGQFVCGAPLCDDCEHTTAADGTNGGIGFNMQRRPAGIPEHCRKSEQQYRPWYERVEEVNRT